MKRAYLLLTAVLCLIALSCTKEETDNLVSTGNRVAVNASWELPGNITKSTLENGVYLWSKGDKIACYTSTGSFQNSDALEEEDIKGDGKLARFWFSLTGDYPILNSVAVSPVYPDVNNVSFAPVYDYAGDDLTIKIPDTMAWKEGEVNLIQIATFSSGSNVSLSFYNVAGMIKFTLNNIPVGANQVLFKTGKRITGDFVIEDVSKKSQNDTYITAGDASDDGITFTFDEVTTAGTSKVFYVPVPTGTYSSIGFRVQNNDGSTLWKKTATVDNTVNRGVIKVMPALTFASATGSGEGDPATIITTLSGQTGTVNLPSATDNVLVELNSTSGELTLAYSEEANAKKPAVVYVRVLADATVGTLNINLPNSTVYLNGKANSNLATLTSVTAESTLKVLESPLTIGTATINQGNVEVAGTVNAIVVASGATSDGQAAGENNKIKLSVSSAAAVQRITLNAVTDVIVEQPKDNIVAENTENKVYVVVNATGSTAKAQNGGDIYVTANANCKVTAEGNDATVVLEENNGVTVTTEEKNNGKITAGTVDKAQIGSTKYTSIVEALEKAKDGDTITLIADNVLTESLVNEKTITIDLGEYSISGAVGQGTAAQSEAGKLINNKGNLTITSANNQGRIWNTCIDQQGRDAVYNAEGATITINGGVFGDSDTDTENDNVNINRGGGIRNYGTAILNGGKFTAANNFTDGNGYAYSIINYGEMTINDGVVVYGKNNGNIANNTGNIVVNGGSFTANGPKTHYNIYIEAGTATINGGTFVKGPLTGGSDKAIHRGGGQVNITGGTFNKLSSGTKLANTATGVSITGGTYTVNPTEYLASGYKATDNGNSTWTVGLDYAAQIGTTNYVTLDDALAEVSDGETITLQKNIDHTSANLVVALGTKNVTLDLNGKTLSGRTNLTSGKLTISNGTVEYLDNQPLNVYGSDNSSAQNYSVLTVNNNVTVNGAYGVCVFGKTAKTNGYGAVVNVEGKLIANNGIFVSGNLGNNVAADMNNIVNISGTLTSESDVAVALNGWATVNVQSGAKITGNTGIAVKRGVLNVYDGATVTANGKWVTPPAANNSGTEPTGAAVSMTNTYNNYGAMAVNIAGGSFTSENGEALYKANQTYSNAATFTVTGGSFSSNPSAYVAAGYAATKTNSVWTVAPVTGSAAIGSIGYETLDAAFAAVKDGETITLQENVDHNSANLDVALETKNVTLDLNGKTLSGRTNLHSGKLTISNGTIQCTKGQPLNVYGSNDSSAKEYSVLTINNNVTVNGAYGVCLFGKTLQENGYGAVVNIKGTINANQGVFVSGNLGNNSTLDNACNVINITGTINGGALGVAINGSSTVNVNSGAKITGGTAIPVKRGKLNVTGGTISATGDWDEVPAANTNGAEVTGAAVSVTSTYNYSGVIDVNISGGTFTSTYGQAVYKYENPAKPYNNASVSITGGTFSSNPSAYVAEGYKATGGNSTWTVTAKN